jgi:hypothetical protein
MKKINYLILSVILSLTFSCETDNSELETIQSEEVFVIGEIGNSSAKSSRNQENKFNKKGLTDCGTSGPLCAFQNQTLSYTYFTPDINPSITWTVNSGNISIISGQGTNTVTLATGSNFNGGQISVEGVGPIGCISTRNILLCGRPNPDGCDYFLGINDEYIDGTQSGADFVYLNAGGNFPNGTTYEWEIRRQNGTIQFYSPSTSNPRLVSASINNRITRATVTAKFEDCEKTVTKTFQCAIPNADINGDLFPECSNLGGGFN